MVIALLAGETALPDTSTSIWSLKAAVERSGLTSIAFSLGFRRLSAKRLIETIEERDEEGEPYPAAHLTPSGWNWVDRNESLFVLRRKVPPEDDIPF